MRKQIILVDTDGMTEDRMNQIKKRFEDDTIIMFTTFGETNTIVFPSGATEDTLVDVGSKEVPIKELLGIYKKQQADKEVDSFLKQMSQIALPVIPDLILDVNDKPSYIPSKGSIGGNPHKPGRNQKIRRR